MTHGEDPSPETHEDSAGLTYLEGLLMHPVDVGPGASAGGRSEGVHRSQEQADKVRVVFQHHSHELTAPKAGANGPALGSSQHLKKARLLQSGAWNDSLSQPMNPPAVDLKGQRGDLQNGSLEVPRSAGESTLLASLLQSFSSRLQSVAMSQQPNPPSSECSSPAKAPPADKDSLQIYQSAAGHLKGLMRKSKHHNHSSMPYSHRGHGQDRAPESPMAVHRSTPPSASSAAESVSCAERLKAVANMVKIRSSPTASPKPSVACSQLALLLSSEAHFQQYSKVHALKAQFSGRCASERLAAIANQQQGQDKRPPSAGRALSPIAAQTGLAETAATSVAPNLLRGSSSPPSMCGLSQSSPSKPPPGPHHSPSNPSREKRGLDSRPSRPPQTCSSLLLLLLNNHNSQKHLTKNGHLEDSASLFPLSCSSSATSDSESSHRDRSSAKDSSDGESSHSSCSPMDLSVRSRASTQEAGLTASRPTSTLALPSSTTATSSTSAPLPLSSSAAGKTFSPCSQSFSSISTGISSSSSSLIMSSLDKLTQSLINKWKPEASAPKAWKDQEPEARTDLKSPPKVTLMQLLLERRNTEAVPKGPEEQATDIQSQANGLRALKETRVRSPLDQAAAPAQALFSCSQYPSSALASFPYLSPYIQSSPLDLCKSKSTSEETASQPAFSASKMLQNLAQSSSSSSPPSKGPAQELDGARRPLKPLESPSAPVCSPSTTPLSDRPSSCGTPSLKEDLQMENLLERRTVLQLLLGTASGPSAAPHKSQLSSSGRALETPGGCCEKGQGASAPYSSTKQAPLAMQFKTEITQESEQSSVIYQGSAGRKESNAAEKTVSVPDFCPSVKKESPAAENASRYGLLSQLLKQQSAAYYSSTAQSRARPLPGDHFLVPGDHLHQARPLPGDQFLVRGDHLPQVRPVPEQFLVPGDHFHVPSPKKRRLCYSQADLLNHISPSQQKVKEEEASLHRAASQGLSRESRGFNVLKQLLLSDNCLKELSQQSQDTASPSVLQAVSKAPEASFSQPHLRGCPPHASHNSGLQSQLEALAPPTAWDNLRLHHTQDRRASVKQEPRSTDGWTSQDTEDRDVLDSPQLSRSNPILYYMLQKGSIHLRKKLAEVKRTPERSIKEESTGELHDCDRNLTSPAHTQTLQLKHSRQSRGLS